MNKQQLAAKIWESANQMRSKIEANEYKDYILGFIFYKYLSDQELKFVKKEGLSEQGIKALSEDDEYAMKHVQDNSKSIPEMAWATGVSERSIERYIQKLQKESKIKRVGGAKCGHWTITKAKDI